MSGLSSGLLALGVVPSGQVAASAETHLPPVVQLSNPERRSDHERIVVTPSGVYVAAWVEHGPEGPRVLSATRTGDYPWSTPRVMGAGRTVELAASEAGEVLLAWPGAVAVRSPAGVWGDAEPVNVGYVEQVLAAPDGSFALASTGSSQVVVRRSDRTWAPAQALNPAPIWPVHEAPPARDLVALPGGGFAATWTSELDPADPDGFGSAAVEAAVADAEGVWSAPVRLADDAIRDSDVELDAGHDGTLVVRYLDETGAYRVVARHDGTWGAPAVAPPGVIAGTPDGFSAPLMSLVTVDGDDAGDQLRTWSSNDGTTWTETSLRVPLPEHSWFYLQVAVGTDDLAAVTRTTQGPRFQAHGVTVTDVDQTSAPVSLGSRDGSFVGTLVATRQGGYAFVADVHGEPDYPLAASFRSPTGTWTPLRTVVPGISVNPYYPFAQVAAHEDRAAIVWSQTEIDENEQELPFYVRSVSFGPAASGPVTPPVTRMTAPRARFQTDLTFPVGWRVDSTAGPTTDEVRRAVTRWNGRTAGPFAHRGANGATFSAAPGRTYCFTARATDTLAQTGDWAAPACTTTPVDDRVLTRTRSWQPRQHPAYYQGTVLLTRKDGATLALRGVQARRLALLATVAPGAGTIKVTHAGRTLGTWSLARKATRHRVVLPLANYPGVRTGLLRIEVVSKGKPVRIDGLYAAR